MNGETTTESVNPVWDWIPRNGHSLRLAGVHFDAVRVAGGLAAQAVRETEGPAVHECVGERYTYFLLPPGTVRSHRWPPGARGLTSGDRCAAYVGIPALRGGTWPLSWVRTPTERTPFVDPAALHAVLCRLAGRHPRPLAGEESR